MCKGKQTELETNASSAPQNWHTLELGRQECECRTETAAENQFQNASPTQNTERNNARRCCIELKANSDMVMNMVQIYTEH